jgi:hypothetical protein
MSAKNQEIINNLNEIQIIDIFKKNKIYHLHNNKGLGDNVFNLILFYIIKDYFIKHNIIIYYYTKNNYIEQLQDFLYNNKNIKLFHFKLKPKYSIELWINTKLYNYTHISAVSNSDSKQIYYNIYYKNFFNIVLEKLKFNIKINKLVYYDEDLLNRYNYIPDKYKNFDILILNSTPLSGQYNYNKADWDSYITLLNNKFKLLTTSKVDNVLCTYDDKLSIKDIASLSTKAKIIIAINSGVFPGLLNYYTLTNVKHFYIFDKRCLYSYPNFENKNNITDITFGELENYLMK